MKKMAGYVKNVAKCLLFLGFCVQIGLGLIWIFQNIGKVPMFTQVQMGILNQHYTFVYVVQLLCAFFAYYTFLVVVRKGSDRKWRYVFGALSLVSIPSVLQCHLSLLPYSFMSTALVVWFTLVVLWLREKRGKSKMVLGVILSVLIMHVVCMMPARTGIETAVSEESPILVSLASRVAWPFLQDDYFNMSVEVKTRIDSDVVMGATAYADGMAQVFFSTIKERYGVDVAKQACKDVIAYEVGFNTRKIVEYVIQDIASYHFPAVANYLHLDGCGYGSVASRNFACFRMYSAKLANFFVVYWMASFILFLISMIVVWILERRKICWRYIVAFGVPMEYAILLFTMQGAGLMDYKKIVFVTLMTYGVMFMAMLPKKSEGKD